MLADNNQHTSFLTAFSTHLENSGLSAAQKAAFAAVAQRFLLWKKAARTWTEADVQAFAAAHPDVSLPAIETLIQFVTRFQPSQTSLALHQYLLALKADGCSKATIRNYRSDINQFCYFAQTDSLSQLLTKPVIAQFLKWQAGKGLANSSLRRKLASIAQFGLWAGREGVVKHNVKWLETPQLVEYLEPPRGASEKETISKVSNTRVNALELRKSAEQTSTRPTPARIRHFSPRLSLGGDNSGIARKLQEQRAEFKSQISSLNSKLRKRRQAWLLPYLTLGVILLAFAGLGVLGYQQLMRDVETPLAYPSTPVRPNRVLSFQGRLTDSATNPITTATNMVFKLYDSGPNASGGNILWSSGTCSVDPDQDGIFAVGLGSDCGTEISQDVFTENSNVWLQVEVGAEVLNPRQSIKTVPYALNAETIQGLPVSATGAATTNTILFMDSAGDVVLGENSPGIRSISGTFVIEGVNLMLQTKAGSNGNIILDADGTGSTIIRDYLSAPGATFSATYAGGTPLVLRGGPSGTANLMSIQNNAGTTLSVFDENGNLGIGTNDPGYKLDINSGYGNGLRVFSSANDYLAYSGRSLSLNGSNTHNNSFAFNITGAASSLGFNLGVTNSYGTDPRIISAGGLVFKVGNSNEASAITAMTLSNSGNVTIPALNTPGGIIYSGTGGQLRVTTAGATGDCLLSNGASAPTFGSCATAVAGSIHWSAQNGAIFAKNSTMDLLIGGQSTSSAKFAFINNANGTPTASISGNVTLNSPGSTAYFDTLGGDSLSFRTSPGGNAGLVDRLTILSNGNIGIGSTAPTSQLEVRSTSNTLSAKGLGFYEWAPTSSSTFNGDLFSLNIGANANVGNIFNVMDNGTSLFSISEAQITSNLPTQFTSPGDVSFAYNINMTNPTSSTIKSNATLYLQAGEVFNSSDLVLRTFNAGDVVIDAAGGVTLAQAQDWTLAASTTALNIQSGLLNLDTVNGRVGIGTTAPGALLSVGSSGGFQVNSSGTIAAATGITSSGNITFSGLTPGHFVKTTTGGQLVTSQYINLATEVTGVLPIANGGTNASTIGAAGSIAYSTGSAYAFTGVGTTGQCLMSGGAGAPTWNSCASAVENLILWKESLGTAQLKNSTLDLLVGGTSTTSAKFAVLNVNSGVPTASLSGTTAGAALYMTGEGTLATTNNRSLLLNPNGGNVGIGTTNATTALFVQGVGNTGSISSYLTLKNPAGGGGGTGAAIDFSLTAASTTHARVAAVRPDGTHNGDLAFFTNQASGGLSEAMRIKFNNSIGIGTTSPTALLHINGGFGANDAFTVNQTLSGNILSASSSGITRMVLTNDGRLGIGTSAPNSDSMLHVVGNTTGMGGLVLQQADAALSNATFATLGRPQLQIAMRGANGYVGGLHIYKSGSDTGTFLTSTSANQGLWTTGARQESTGGSNSFYTFQSNAAAISQSSGNILFYADNGLTTGVVNSLTERMRINSLGNVGIGTSNPTSLLSVGSTSQFQVNSSGQIAAAAGITSSGNITFSSLNTAGGIVYTNGSGQLLTSSAGTAGQCLMSGGTGAPTFGSCADAVSSSILWQESLGTAHLKNSTLDLLVGGNSTSSAKFAVLNVNSGTPTASLSGTTTGAAVYMTGEGTLATTNNRSLLLNPNGGNVGIGTTNPTSRLDLAGGTLTFDTGEAIYASSNELIFNANSRYNFPSNGGNFIFGSSTVGFSGSSGDITLRNNSPDITLMDNAASGKGFNLKLTSGDFIFESHENFDQQGQATRMIITNSGLVGIGTTTPTALLDVAGSASLSGTLSFRGTTDPKINILNGENFGIQTSLNGDAGLVERFTFTNAGRLGINTTSPVSPISIVRQDYSSAITVENNGFTTNAFQVTSSGNVNARITYDGRFLSYNGSQYVPGFAFDDDENTGLYRPGADTIGFVTDSSEKMRISSTGNVGIGTTNTSSLLTVGSSAGFQVNSSGQIAAATGITSSGNITFSGLSAGQFVKTTTGGQLTTSQYINLTTEVTGTLPIANGGTNATTIGSAGSVAYSNGSSYAFSSVGSAGECLMSGGTGAPTWGSCADAVAGSILWQQVDGTSQLKNTTLDMLVGGTSTASAKFAVLSVNTGTPTASISSGVNGNGLFMTADGTISTARNASLALNPTGGNVGIGTSSPDKLLTISGSTPNQKLGFDDLGMYMSRSGDGSYQASVKTDGSSSAPSILYNSYNGHQFSVLGGSQGLRIWRDSANGNVAKVLIGAGSGTAGNSLFSVNGNAAIGNGYTGINAPVNGLIVQGDIGIGTSSPSFKAQIEGGDLMVGYGTSTSRRIFAGGGDGVGNNLYAGVIGGTGSGGSSNAGYVKFGAYLNNGLGEVNYLALTRGGLVGVGTTAPTAKLDIAGSASTSGTLSFRGTTDPKIDVLNGENFGIRTSPGGDAGLTERLTILNNGNVGIGTTNPAAKLDVMSNMILRNDASNGFQFSTYSNGNIYVNPVGAASSFGFYHNYNSAGSLRLGQGGTSGEKDLSIFNNGNNINVKLSSNGTSYLNALAGNVGIGTSSPGAKLDVDGTLRASGNVTFSALNTPGGIIYAGTAGQLGVSAAGTAGQCLMSGGTGAPTFGSCADAVSSSIIWQESLGTAQLKNSTLDLLVGGQSTASAKFAVLNVNSGTPTASIAGSVAGAATFITGDGIIATTNNRSLAINPDGGRVGIGTSSPSQKLEVTGGNLKLTTDGSRLYMPWQGRIEFGTNQHSIYNDLNLTFNQSTGSNYGFIFNGHQFRVQQGSNVPLYANATTGRVGIGTTSTIGRLYVEGGYGANDSLTVNQTLNGNILSASSSGTTRMVLTNAGNLGIGTTSPAYPLEVNGTIGFSGTGGNLRNAAGTQVYLSGADMTLTAADDISVNTGTGTASSFNINTDNFFVRGDGLIGIGTTTPGATLDIIGSLQASGNVTFTSLNTAGGIVYTNGSGQLLTSAAGTSGECLMSGGAAAPTWGNCADAVSSSIIWQESLGTAQLKNSSLDLLVGGQSTASAKFAVLNVNNGTPTASIAGSVSGAATFITGDGTIATSNNRTLALNPNGGNVGIGTTNALHDLQISRSGEDVTTFLSGDSSRTQGSYFYSTDYGITRPANSGTLQFLTGGRFVWSQNGTEAMRLENTGNLRIGTSGTLNHKFAVSGTSAAGGNALAVLNETGGNDIFTASASGTTRMVLSNAGDLGIGTTTPNNKLQVNDGNLAITGSNRKLIVEQSSGSNTNFANLWVGSSLALFQYPSGLKFGIQAASSQGDSGASGYSMMSFGSTRNTMFGDMSASQTDPGHRLTVKGSTSNNTNAALNVINSSDTSLLYVRNDGNIGIGTTAPASLLSIGSTSQFQVNSSGAITAATGITSSGNITFSGLTANRFVKTTTGGQLTTSQYIDLTSDVTGVLPLANGGTNKTLTAIPGGIVYSDADSLEIAAAGTSGQCLVSGGTGAPTWGACDSAAAYYWQLNSNVLSPGNSTYDLAIGGTSTAAAKFHVNAVSGTITAAGDINLSGAGTRTIQTTATNAGLNINANGTGTLSLDTTGAGTVTVGQNAATINLGSGTNNETINIGNSTGNDTINIGSSTGSDTVNILTGTSGTQNINLGNSANGVNLLAYTAATTGNGFAFNANALTTGAGMYLNSSSITSGQMLRLNQSASTFSGTGIYANFGTSGGTFTGNYLNFLQNGSSRFSINYRGGINGNYTTPAAGETINLNNLTYTNLRQDPHSYSALNVSGNQVTITSNTSGGTDEPLDNAYEAFKINSGSYNSIANVRIRMKKGPNAMNTGYVTAYLRADNGGVPGTTNLATSQNIYAHNIGLAYANHDFSLSYNATNNTDYWVVVRYLGGLGPNDIIFDSNTTGVDQYAYSANGTSWTTTNTKPYFYVYTRSSRAISASSFSGYGMYGSSTTGTGIYGISTNGYGVYGTSTHGYGGYFQGNNALYVQTNGSVATGIQQYSLNTRSGNRYQDVVYNTWYTGNAFDVNLGNPQYTPYIYHFDGTNFTNITNEARYYGGSAYTVLADTDDYFYMGRSSGSSSYRNMFFDIANTPNLSGVTWEIATGNSGGACTWTAVTPLIDETNGLTRDGMVQLPTNTQVACTVNGQSGYWYRVSASSVTTPPTASASNFGMFSGYFARYYNATQEKFRINYDGVTYTGGQIYPGSNTSQTGIQTARYMYDTGSAIGFNTNLYLTSAADTKMTIQNSDTTLGLNQVLGKIGFEGSDASGNGTGEKANLTAFSENATGNAIGLSFATSDANSATGIERMRITSNGNIGIGTTAAPSMLTVGASGGFQVNSAGSISAATGITSSGNITFSNLNVAGGIVYTNASGQLGTVAGNTGECLLSNGTGAPTFGSCTGAVSSSILWQQSLGTAQLKNSSLDLLVGGQSTASAKFAVLNVNNGVPTASVSTGVNGQGLYMTADGTISTARNASLALNPNGGNVGIGTTAPVSSVYNIDKSVSETTKLHISGGSIKLDADAGLFIGNENNIPGNQGGAHFYYNATDNDIYIGGIKQGVGRSDILLSSAGGNVAIGTTNPQYKLDIVGSTGPQLRIMNGTSGQNDAYMRFSRGTNDYYWDIGQFSTAVSDFEFKSQTGGVVMHLDYDGNVGIGTTAPTDKLSLANGRLNITGTSGTGEAIKVSNSEVVNFDLSVVRADQFRASAVSNQLELRGGTANTRFLASNGSTELVTIEDGGNVGVNTSSPRGKLDVKGNLTVTGGYGTASSGDQRYPSLGGGVASPNAGSLNFGDNTGWKFHFGTQVASTFTPRVTFVDSGNVGIGTTTPAALLSVGSSSQFQVNSSGSIAAATGITSSGNITFSGLTAGRFVKTTTGGQLTTSQYINLGTEVTGTLPIANGGTNASTIGAAGSIAYSTGTAYAFSGVGTTGECLMSGGTGSPTWGSCAGAVASSIIWQQVDGTAQLKNSSLDLLIGGQSTASAKFAVLNVNNGTPVASISTGVNGNAVSIGANGTISTARNATLSINPTGGNVGIGTTSSGSRLDVASTGLNTDVQRWLASDGSRLARVTETSGGHGWFEVDNSSGTAVALFRADGGSSYINAGNFGIGTTAPASLLSVGSTSQFQVDSSGAIAAATGITSSGNITFSGLTAGRFVKTTTGGLLTTSQYINLTSEITGVLPLANGGTNKALTAVAGGIVYSDGDSFEISAAGSAGQCLQSAGTGAPTWGSCAAGADASIFWNQANGSVFAKNSTVDMLIGGQATASAKFAVLNVNNGTPTASVSTGVNGQGLYMTADGTISTARNASLTINPNGGNVGIGTTTPGSTLDVAGKLTIRNIGDADGAILQEYGSGSALEIRNLANNAYYGAMASYFAAEDGSVSTPGFAFLNDFNTGIRRPGADTLAIVTGGADRVTIASNGNVGIGTTTTTAGRLTVTGGDVALTAGVQVDFAEEVGDKALWYSNTYGTGIESNTLTDWSSSRHRWRIGGTSVSTGTEYMSLTTTGLKIGATGDATATVDVAGTLKASGNVTFSGLTADRFVKTTTGGLLTTSQYINLTSEITGVLPLANGGTNKALTPVAGGIVYSDGDSLEISAAGSAGQCLQSAGTGAPTWGSCAAGADASIFWNQANGALFSKNSTVDMLVGGNATTSAKFAVLNVNNGTPTASISSGLNGNGLYMAADGNIQTTRNQALTIGGNTTGNITLSPLNGSGTVTSTGNFNLNSGKAFQINGTNVLNSTTLGSGVTTSSLTAVGALSTGSIANGFGTIATTNTITGTTINGTTGINTGAGAGTQRLDSNGNLVNIGDAAINGGDITTNQTTFNLLNATATTINFGGAATTLNLGATTGTTNVRNNLDVAGTFTSGTSNAFTINASGAITAATGITSSGTITFSGLTANRFVKTTTGGQLTTSQYIDLSSEITGVLPLANGGTNKALTAVAGGIVYSDSDSFEILAAGTTGQCLTSGGSGAPTWGTCGADAVNYWQLNNKVLTPANATHDLAIGGISTSSAKFFISGTTGNASSSGTLSFTGANPKVNILNGQNFGIQLSPGGDAGLQEYFTILKNGNVGIGTTNPGSKLEIAGANSIISNGSGNISIQPASNLLLTQGGFGIGTTSPLGLLHVNGKATGKALAILNEIGDQDIFTASASGTTRLRLTNTGTLLAQSFADIANTNYFLDPANAGVSLAVAGKVGIGTTTASTPLDVVSASTTLAKFTSTGANRAAIVIDNLAGGQQSSIILSDAAGSVWEFGKQTNNSFFLYNNALASDIFNISTAGNTHFNYGLSLSNGRLLDLSAITHATSTPQGLKLPQGATLANISGGGEGYLAWNTSEKKLQVFDGTNWVNVDAGVDLYSATDANVVNGGYVEVKHNQNTNDLIATGWYYDSVSSQWKEVDNNSNGVITGSGADGALAPSGTFDLNTSVSGSRSYADGIAYRVTPPSDNSTSVTRYSGSDTISNGIAAGDEVMLVNLQGTNTDYTDVGNYEFMKVASVTSSTITFTESISKSYDGTSAANQKVVIQRVPNYTTVTLDTSDSLTASAWDGLTTTPSGTAGYFTGIVAFRATGDVNVGSGSSISTDAKGYRGGQGGAFLTGGATGESYNGNNGTGGSAGTSTQPTDGGGRYSNGGTTSPANGAVTGGGGGGGSAGTGGDGNDGAGGGGGGAYAGGGGGGGGGGDSSANGGAGGGGGNTDVAAGGGGGGGSTGGAGGNAGSNGNAGTSGGAGGGVGSGATGGSGAGAQANASGGAGGGGGGGLYGSNSLGTIHLGSGGGGGGGYRNTNTGATGGTGGGIIFIGANNVNVIGQITSNGGNGVSGSGGAGSGGGGAGGSIFIAANSVYLASSTTTATGGSSVGAASRRGGAGGGGVGRVYIESPDLVGANSNPSMRSSPVFTPKSLSSSGLYEIVQVDANTVRLYNFTGATQNLRLNVTVNGDGSVGGGSDQWAKTGTNVHLATETDNVGIGTTAPNSKLDVAGDIRGSGFHSWSTWGNMSMNAFWDSVDSRWEYIGAGYASLMQQNGSTGGLEFMVANSGSANGAISFDTVLDIAANGDIALPNLNTDGGILFTNGSGTLAQTSAGSAGQCLVSSGGGTPTWGTCGSGGSSYWRLALGAISPVNDTLDVLVGSTATSSARFAVTQTKISSNLPHEFTSAGDVSVAYDLQFTNQTASYIKSYGPLTIESGESFENNDLTLKTYGTGAVIVDAPGLTLDADVDANSTLRWKEAGTQKWSIANHYSNDQLQIYDADSSAGVYLAQNATSWTALSDQRLKTNLTEQTGLLEKIGQLSAYTYNFNGNSNREMGVIAQELLPLFPELVTFDGTYYGVNYDRLGVIALGGIKEQQQLITGMNTRLANIESQVGSDAAIDTTGNFTAAVLTQATAQKYTVTLANNTLVDRVLIASESVVGNLRAGFINAQNIATQTLTATTEVITNRLVATRVETDVIAPATTDDVTIKLESEDVDGTPGELKIVNEKNETVASIDGEGNANFSGTTQLGSLITQDASISGDLTVDGTATFSGMINATSARIATLETRMAELEHIKAQTADIVNATVSGTLYATDIYGFQDRVASALQEPSLMDQLLGRVQNATASTDLNPLFNIVDENPTLAMGASTLNKSLSDLMLGEDDITLGAAALFVNQYFEVNGSGYIADSLGIGNSLRVGQGTLIADGIIEYTSPVDASASNLHIQPSGRGTITMMAGLMTLTEDGTVTINGNVHIAGDLKVEDTLLTNLLAPTSFDKPFQVQVAGVSTESAEVKKSRFEIVNELGAPVATISADGQAEFAGLSLGKEDLSATSSAILTASKSSGKATIKQMTTGVTIYSDLITENSLIYITPIGSTGNKVMYVKSQTADNKLTPEADGSFTVGFDTAATRDTDFYWWIVQ